LLSNFNKLSLITVIIYVYIFVQFDLNKADTHESSAILCINAQDIVICVYVYVDTHTNMYKLIAKCVYIYVYTNIDMCMYTHTHRHM
jgi:hypothetical protein